MKCGSMRTNLADLIEKERVIELEERSRAVFVGDTHGDVEASKRVWRRFGEEVEEGSLYLVFLGDYVDRGNRSKENIEFLISKKAENRDGLILLLGNHDAYHLQELRPANFWRSLGSDDYNYFKNLAYLPWVVIFGDIVGAHGSLPFIKDNSKLEGPLDELYRRKNDFGIPIWVSVAWGDLNPKVERMRIDPLTQRPQFGKKVFLEYMDEHDRSVLIRSHQPGMQGWAFDDRALTIFTSEAYVQMGRARERNVAVVNLGDGATTRSDIQVLGLDQI